MKLIDGKKIAAQKMAQTKETVELLDVEPSLAVLLIGDDPASHLYVKLKERAAKEIGIELRKYTFDKDVSKEEVKSAIEFLNNDKDTNGIIVQLPLPKQLNIDEIVNFVDPQKDVDGFHEINQEKFLNNKNCIYPVFPGAIMSLIDSEMDNIKSKKVIVIGKSDVFDKVMTHALTTEGALVEFISCNDKNKFNKNELKTINNSDIIVTACGNPGIIECNMIADNTVVIDGGISKVEDKTVGDIDMNTCSKRKIILSPVPGGVGPVTIACLLENVAEVTKKQN